MYPELTSIAPVQQQHLLPQHHGESDRSTCDGVHDAIHVGCRVMGNYNQEGTWYEGLVAAVDNGLYSIAYDDGDYECDVKRENVCVV